MPNSSRKIVKNLNWLPAYLWQRLARRSRGMGAPHLIFSLADHFEPAFMPGGAMNSVDPPEQERRVERWCEEYPGAVGNWRDSDGYPWRHTYFYPAEQFAAGVVGRLAQHCHEGWGEIEVQLHHGVEAPDTPENTRRILSEFKGELEKLGCLSHWERTGPSRYAFVHGNWALANSLDGNCCGVDSEMKILSETGCYADFTLPCAPNRTHVGKLNSLYECALPFEMRAPHRKGIDLQRGRRVEKFPVIVQGPLMLDFSRLPIPRVDNGALTGGNPPSLSRLELWRRAGITVRGGPDWLFIKLNCHSMDPRDDSSNSGAPLRAFLKELTEATKRDSGFRIYFTTAREMVNIMLAALDGKEGSPGQYRDYRLCLVASYKRP